MRRDSGNWRTAPATADLFTSCKLLIDRLFMESGAHSWRLTRDDFASALARSATKHFGGPGVPSGKLEDYLGTLHLEDLALACACAEGHGQAWDHFVLTYRNYLRTAAAAILRCSAGSPAACELADSLFADLYGLTEGKRSERSLFRYFHGRSSLRTWLRAVLAQRHIDGIRASRRFSEVPEEDQNAQRARRETRDQSRGQAPDDPHRERYAALFTRALEGALGLLDPRDKERLRLYYAEEHTLAEIGRRFGDHESSVSRNLERTRRELRYEVEQILRKDTAAANGLRPEPGLSEEEISLCFEYAAEDAPIDLDRLFPEPSRKPAKSERKEP
jgi:RNA polymerase sigma-70 factor